MTQEEKQDLLEMLPHPGMKPLMKLLQSLAEGRAQDMVKFSLSGEDSERELIRMKCRAEGSAQLLADFKRSLDTLKAKQKA
jgi:hypothetical protein